LVEDESNLAFLLAERLHREGYEVETCGDGEHGLIQAASGNFDLAILDIMLPGRSGFDICRELRHRDIDLPILMLTARGGVDDRVTGLKLGADDYLAKPFEVTELLARIEALLRRAKATRKLTDSVFCFEDLTVDFRRKEVTRRGQTIELSAREFQLLSYLIAHREAAISREELLDKVWGYQSIPNTRTVDVHVAQLRQKLEDNPKEARYIVTVYGCGYKFVPSPEPSGIIWNVNNL
jgi:two-component system, OmpR family, alkaline phosphatase synthesis response regulator PhoP